jgi:hypothetical protein
LGTLKTAKESAAKEAALVVRGLEDALARAQSEVCQRDTANRQRFQGKLTERQTQDDRQTNRNQSRIVPEQLTITQVAALQTSTKDLSVASATARGEYDSKLRAGQEVFESAKAKLAACDGKLSAALVEQARLQKLVKELEGTCK